MDQEGLIWELRMQIVDVLNQIASSLHLIMQNAQPDDMADIRDNTALAISLHSLIVLNQELREKTAAFPDGEATAAVMPAEMYAAELQKSLLELQQILQTLGEVEARAASAAGGDDDEAFLDDLLNLLSADDEKKALRAQVQQFRIAAEKYEKAWLDENKKLSPRWPLADPEQAGGEQGGGEQGGGEQGGGEQGGGGAGSLGLHFQPKF